MSSYTQWTFNPDVQRWESAFWIDDYFGPHHQGVQFPDGSVRDPWKEHFRTGDLTDAEVARLNEDT